MQISIDTTTRTTDAALHQRGLVRALAARYA
jgi:hypothetical protein